MAQHSRSLGTDPPEDCRDYLRTGRCKYGTSCKYNHPPNVQSGGGIKPLDPTEPPFPLRPNEPPCQYYLKHGTCKFGQACKFHHPPLAANVAGGTVSGAVVMNVNGTGLQQHLFVNANRSDGGSAMILQFLPQRPGEPDCIYFLRNGRCKYGATCRYHHPLNVHHHRQQFDVVGVGGTRQQQQGSVQVQLHTQHHAGTRGRSHSAGSAPESLDGLASSVHYISQSSAAPTHILVGDAPVAVVAVKRPAAASSVTTSLQQAAGGGSGGGSTHFYRQRVGPSSGNAMGAPPQEHSPSISSSSVASSYETASSGFEFLPAASSLSVQQHVQADSTGGLWHRSSSQQHLPSFMDTSHQRSESGGSLNAYVLSESSLRPSQARHQSHHGTSAGLPMMRSTGFNSSEHEPTSSLREAAEAGGAVNPHLMQQRHRASSLGSTSEGDAMYSGNVASGSQYRHDGTGSTSWHSAASLSTPSLDAAGTVATGRWEDSAFSSLDQVKLGREVNRVALRSSAHGGSSQLDRKGSGDFSLAAPFASARHGGMGTERRYHQRAQASNVEDDGLSKMTSALLNMLDTPDETGANDGSSATARVRASLSRQEPSSAPSTPRHGSTAYCLPVSARDESADRRSRGTPSQSGAPQNFSRVPFPSNSSSNDDLGPGGLIPAYYPRTPPSMNHGQGVGPEDQTTPVAVGSTQQWSPKWEGAPSTHELERNAQSVASLQHSPNTPASSHTASNIGLYLS